MKPKTSHRTETHLFTSNQSDCGLILFLISTDIIDRTLFHQLENLNPDVFDFIWIKEFGRTLVLGVALTGEVFGPDVQVGSARAADRHVLPVSPPDDEVDRVQVQVAGVVIVLPDAAAFPLAQDLAAQHGGRSHVGDVRVQGGLQEGGQRPAGRLGGTEERSEMCSPQSHSWILSGFLRRDFSETC